MRRASLALLLAVVPGTLPTATAAPGSWPAGEVVYRPSCFDDVEAEKSFGPQPQGAVVSQPQTPVITGGSRGSSAPKPKPVRQPAPTMPAELFEAEEDAPAPVFDRHDAGGALERPEPSPKPRPPVQPAPRDEEQQAPRTRLDRGATVYLSNDDSMSLASAQRVLFAVMNGRSFSPREVRPHELLNYFGFDTVEPSDAQLFDVLASAERHGDELSVALAVKGATPPRQPLDLTLVVDRSCSMDEEGRMDYTKQGLRIMQDQLEDGDRIDVVLFDDRICTPLEGFVVGRDDPRLLRETIDRMQPRGATDLDLGLREGYAVASRKLDTHRRNRRMMVVTDAMLNTGDVDPHTVSEIGRAYEDDRIRLTGVGVGRDFNDEVLDLLTEKGKGAYVYLGSEAVVERVFGIGFDSLTRTIAHDVQFALDLPDSLAMERFYGEEASTVASDVQPIHYYAGTSQVFLQDLRVVDEPAASDPVTLTITYRDAVTGEPEKRTFRTTVGRMLEADPHNVRKARALVGWSDLLLVQAMGGEVCGEPAETYARLASAVPDDAEIAFVTGLVRQRCPGLRVPEVVSTERVAWKVRVDSDIPIAEVGLTCGAERWTQSLSGSDTVARFEAVPGACTVVLFGNVEMAAKVEVPSTGGDARCLVRGGRLSCG